MVRQLPPPHLKHIPPPPPPPAAAAVPPKFSADVVVNHYYHGVGDKLIPSIPGFRTSAAFLTSLSANLRLPDDDLLPSPMSTPPSMRSSASSLPLPPPPVSTSTALSANPSPASTVPTPRTRASPDAATSANTDDAAPPPLPELRTYVATADDDRVAGLKLVADSIAQQRQLASRALLAHPAHLALYVAVLAAIAQYLYRRASDLPLVMTTWAGVTMAALAGVRWATGGYIFLAEEVNWEWLGEDTMVVVRWGEEVIGALVLGWADEVGGGRRGKGRGKKCGRGVVRAWTVRLKYRGKGVGEGLLEEAVRVCMERGAEGVEFAEDHANSKRLLPKFYNGFLDKRDRRARKALEKVANEKGNFGQRR